MRSEDCNNPMTSPKDDAEKILEVYAKLPDDKKPVLLAVLNALISGMEIQETLSAGEGSV